MARPLNGKPLGVYIHVPWCSRLCPYCDFAVVIRPRIDHQAYLNAVLTELDARQQDLPGRQLKSIYFGGGTPSLWRPDCIEATITAIQGAFPSEEGESEITVECNPNTEHPVYAALAEAGANRVSLGVQSFDDSTLAALGRTHTGDEAQAAVRAARAAGIARITADLIFGASGQTAEMWRSEVQTLVGLGVGHASLYQLTIEDQTVFGREVARGRRKPPDDDLCASMYNHADALLTEAGFKHYEVSSWAKAGQESRHNNLYWDGSEYLGLGMGAHSLRFAPDGRVLRRGNARSLRAYLASPLGDDTLVEVVDERTHLTERLMTGLRTAVGIDLAALQGALTVDVMAAVGSTINTLVASDLLCIDGHRLRPTRKGLALGDWIAQQFMV